jgi:predicted transcriptional regulator
MTFAELNSYKDKVEQLEIIREELKAEYLKGIDPSQVSVQTGTVGDPTALFALRSMELERQLSAEFNRLVAEIEEIQRYIFSIQDEIVKTIAELKFIKGMTYEEIGEKMNYHYSTCIKKLNTYLSQHSQKSQ